LTAAAAIFSPQNWQNFVPAADAGGGAVAAAAAAAAAGGRSIFGSGAFGQAAVPHPPFDCQQ